MSNSAAETDFRQVGLDVLTRDELRQLRQMLRISVSCQAFMIGVGPAALSQWESGRRKPNRASLTRIGQWYCRVTRQPEFREADFTKLIHITVASQKLALSYSTIVKWCREGRVDAVQFDGLGWFLDRQQTLEMNRWAQNG